MSISTTSTSRSNRKAKGDGHERRAEILTAAERIFVESGYDGATIRKIADEVGLSSTALYMHFADKSEILNEICRNTFERLAERNLSILADTEPSLARLRRIAESYVAFGLEHPNAYRLAYLTPTAETRHGAETIAQKAGGELFEAVVSVVEDAVEQGVLRGDARIQAQVIWACVHGLVSLLITKPYFDWADREVLIRTQLDVLFNGLAAR